MKQFCIFLAIVILGVTCIPSRVRRQFDWNQGSIRQPPPNNFDEFDINNNNAANNQGVNNGLSSTTAGTTTTRAPASYTNCMNRCLYTKEYNPVCGTDGNTYSNRNELNCAIQCGRNVQHLRGGTCQPL